MENALCPKHSSSGGLSTEEYQSNQAQIDEVVSALPRNHSGEGKEKCAYCAYEWGLMAGRRLAIKEVIQQFDNLIKEGLGWIALIVGQVFYSGWRLDLFVR